MTGVLATISCLLGLAGPVNALEVASDIKIPPPSEMVIGAPAVGGIATGPASTFGVAGLGQVFQGAASQAALGLLTEAEARSSLGPFMTSLLVREGVVTFAPQTAGASLEKREDGSRPVWAGPTPMVVSASRARRP
jgi:hypothetical protein